MVGPQLQNEKEEAGNRSIRESTTCQPFVPKIFIFCQKDQNMSLRGRVPTLEVFIHHKSANLIQKARLTAAAQSGKSQMVQDSRE